MKASSEVLRGWAEQIIGRATRAWARLRGDHDLALLGRQREIAGALRQKSGRARALREAEVDRWLRGAGRQYIGGAANR